MFSMQTTSKDLRQTNQGCFSGEVKFFTQKIIYDFYNNPTARADKLFFGAGQVARRQYGSKVIYQSADVVEHNRLM